VCSNISSFCVSILNSTYPQGRISICATASAVITSIACLNVSAGCYYVKVDGVFPDYDGAVLIGYGGHEELPPRTNSECVFWEDGLRDDFWDGPWLTGFAFAIMATIFSVVPMICSFTFACFAIDIRWTKLCAYMMILASLCEFLSFIGFTSDICTDDNCTFAFGAGSAILGGVVAMVTAGILMKISHEPDFDPVRAVLIGGALAPGTVQVTEQVFPDGIKKTTKTTVGKDGSRTVVETVEVPTLAA
jgi:hypothetical protein